MSGPARQQGARRSLGNRPDGGALLAISMAALISFSAVGLARYSFTALLPPMKESLGLSNTEAGLLSSAYTLGYLAIGALAGVLVSKYGARLVVIGAMALTTVGVFATGFWNRLELLAAMRVLTGLGSGGANVPGMVLASQWFPSRRRGVATGAVFAAGGFAFAVTGLLVPPVVGLYGMEGWQYAWFYLGLLILLSSLPIVFFLQDAPQASRSAREEVLPGGSGVGRADLGLRKTVYSSTTAWRLSAIYFFYGLSMMTAHTFFAVYFAQERGMGQSEAGRLWAVVGMMTIPGGLLCGGFSDRVGRRLAFVIVHGGLALTMVFLSSATNIASAYAASVMYGLLTVGVPTVMAAACGDYLGPRLAPAVFGMATTCLGIGQLVGPTLGGIIADINGSFVNVFYMAAIGLLVGMFVSLTLSPPPTEPGKEASCLLGAKQRSV